MIGKKRCAIIAAYYTPVYLGYLSLLVLQSRLGDKPLGIRVVCSQKGTAVLKGVKTNGRGGGSLFGGQFFHLP